MMKRLLQLAVVLCSVSLLYADNYEIIRMTMPEVKIGGKVCRRGDTFSDNSVIAWDKGKEQIIKARNTKTKEIVRFYSTEFQKRHAPSVKDYFVQVKRMSTRSVGKSLDDLVDKLEDTRFYLVDTICIESPVPVEKVSYVASYSVGKLRVTKTLPTAGNSFLIVRSMFEPYDTVGNIKLRISLCRKDLSEEYMLTDKMRIRILPKFIDD
ncbi:MAG: hypothetical protein J5900_02760 [Prevotella sp.]|nr:hypothetical protein [Prevotella sp.]